MEKIYKPIIITDSMITTKSFKIPIDKENFIAIEEKDTNSDNPLWKQLSDITGFDVDYSGMFGPFIFIEIDLLEFEKTLLKVQNCINEYTRQARIESDFFSDGENL